MLCGRGGELFAFGSGQCGRNILITTADLIVRDINGCGCGVVSGSGDDVNFLLAIYVDAGRAR